jgi:lysine-specific demethylase 8
LRLYTDVSIIRGVFDVALAQTHVSTVKAAIRRLDMAIIVGGGVGPRRQEWIQALLNMLSNRLPAEHRSGSEPLERSNKRRKTGNDGNREPLLFAPNRIPSRRLPPTVLQYITEDSKRPFILREHLASGASNMPPWPALHRWKLASYLLEAVGEGRVVPVEVGAAYDDSDWGQRIIPFRDFLARAGFDVDPETEGASEGPPLYLAQHPLFTQFPVLQRDISLPDFVWSDPPPPTYMPDYSPPPNDVGVIINVWIGSGSGEIVSPAHTVWFVL